MMLARISHKIVREIEQDVFSKFQKALLEMVTTIPCKTLLKY